MKFQNRKFTLCALAATVVWVWYLFMPVVVRDDPPLPVVAVSTAAENVANWGTPPAEVVATPVWP